MLSSLPKFFVIEDLSSRALIGTGECVEGLYRTGTRGHALMTSSGTWTKRLGNAYVSKLCRFDFIKNISVNSNIVYDSCIKAKFTRLPFHLSNTKPGFDHLRGFGCQAYYRSIETRGDKVEMRGRPGVFFDYSPRTKGYKIYDPQHNKIIV